MPILTKRCKGGRNVFKPSVATSISCAKGWAKWEWEGHGTVQEILGHT